MCPYVDAGEPRCASHLTLDNLDQALEHCADRFAECPVYREMIRHAERPDPFVARPVRVAG